MYITITMKKFKCLKCKYEWKNKVDKPKSCPRCKVRFDWFPIKEQVARQPDKPLAASSTPQ